MDKSSFGTQVKTMTGFRGQVCNESQSFAVWILCYEFVLGAEEGVCLAIIIEQLGRHITLV